jgi:RNA polymerase sigma factor (TIGR02999 family)
VGAADVTTLLHAWSAGDACAKDRLVPLVYEELHRRAAASLKRERRNHTLQPTALVHEAYLRLVNQDRAVWENRAQFFGLASELMRRILVDHARRARRAKRSGQWTRVTLDEGVRGLDPRDVVLLDLDAALSRLAEVDPRKSRLAELRFFSGLSLPETAHVLGVSLTTAEREWRTARAWLFAHMKGQLR